MKTTTPSLLEIPINLPRGRHTLSREQVRTSQRTRLLDAFAELVAEKGYAKVTIADIVSTGGVAKRTFYDYFADKEACFQAAGEYLAGKIAEAIVIPHNPSMNLYHRAEATIRGLLQVLQDHPAYARASFVEVWAAGAQATRRRLGVTRQLAQLLASLSQDVTRHQPDASAITETHALAVIDAVDAYIFRVIYTEGAEHLTDHIETVAQLATGFLKADMSRLTP
jgi:AcrR family transcriptional regulator